MNREVPFWACVVVVGLLLYSVLFFKRIRLLAAVVLVGCAVWAVGVRYANEYGVDQDNGTVLQMVPEPWKLRAAVLPAAASEGALHQAVLQTTPDGPHECILKHGTCSKGVQRVTLDNVVEVARSFPKDATLVLQEHQDGKEFQVQVQADDDFQAGRWEAGKYVPIHPTAALKEAVGKIAAAIPGTHFTELLVRAASEDELKQGTFKVLKTRGALHSSLPWAKKAAGKKVLVPWYAFVYQVRVACQGWKNIVSGRVNPSFGDVATQARLLRTCKDPYFFCTTRA